MSSHIRRRVFTFCGLGLAVAFSAFRIVGAAAEPVPNFADPVKPIANSKQYNQLRSHAKSAEEFAALTAYCQALVSKYEADKNKNQAELDQYNSKQHIPNPKFRSKDELLKSYIASDEKAIARWSELVAQYTDQAHKLAGAKAER